MEPNPTPVAGPLGRPIVYEAEIQVRFSDLDMNGHVNTAAYLDYVLAGRWLYFQRRFGLGVAELAERGLAFYVVRAETFFKKEISGREPLVRIRSFVQEAKGPRMVTYHEILSAGGEVQHSNGTFDFVAIDLERGKPIRMPEWAVSFFFEA